MKKIIAIGNPNFKFTRHNIGADIVSSIYNIPYGIHHINDVTFCVAADYVNNSGSLTSLNDTKLIVIVDDVESKFNQITYGLNLGARGHNGIRNIKTKNINFYTIRIGVGKDVPLRDYVIGRFSDLELNQLFNKENLIKIEKIINNILYE